MGKLVMLRPSVLQKGGLGSARVRSVRLVALGVNLLLEGPKWRVL